LKALAAWMEAMKYASDREFADPEKAARKLPQTTAALPQRESNDHRKPSER